MAHQLYDHTRGHSNEETANKTIVWILQDFPFMFMHKTNEYELTNYRLDTTRLHIYVHAQN